MGDQSPGIFTLLHKHNNLPVVCCGEAVSESIKSSNEDECFLVSLPVFSMRQSLSHSVTDGPIY